MAITASSLTFTRHGAAFYPGAAHAILPALEGVLSGSEHNASRGAGTRFADLRPISGLLRESGIAALVQRLLGKKTRPVRAVLFDKTPDENWALAWHQDRTIAVRAREETEGFRNWTVKQGITHVEPPFALLSRMATLRLHLTTCRRTMRP